MAPNFDRKTLHDRVYVPQNWPHDLLHPRFTLNNCGQNIRGNSRPWLFWPLAILFALVLLGVVALVVFFVVETIWHR